MPDAKTPFHNPFAQLKALRGETPAPVEPPAPAPAAPVAQPPPGRTIPRAVVRYERSGRGGKQVTLVEHLEIRPTDREAWLKALKSALGCGGSLEGDALVLQGDQRARLPKLLAARGVRKVTVS
jgi:translation initiation factor 1